jgi:hypothetical protein
MFGPDGQPVILVVALWHGDRYRGERAIAAADGCHWEIRTRWLPMLTAGAADAIIAAMARGVSPHCSVFWHHFHGAAARVAPDGDAFGLRCERFMMEIIAGWKPDGDDGTAHRRWAQDLWQSLAPFALPGGYAILLGPNDRKHAAGAYGGNGARLQVLKCRFDPDGVFASAIPLPEG